MDRLTLDLEALAVETFEADAVAGLVTQPTESACPTDCSYCD